MASQLNTYVVAGTTAAANLTCTTIDFFNLPRQTQTVCAQFLATSLSAADGVLKIQESNDDTNYVDISGATITLASGSSAPTLTYTSVRTRYIRFVWSKGTNASGTFGITVNLV